MTPAKTSGTGMSPDLDTMFELAAGNTVAAHVRAGIPEQDINRDLTQLAPQHILLYTLLVLIALMVNIALASRVAKPVKTVARVAQQISAGDLSERVQGGLELGDEVGDLARNFNQMADQHQLTHERIIRLNSELEERVA